MKYKTQSANVLNEADRFEQILNVTLFTHEQNNRLWGYNPKVSWKPGDPIHKHPDKLPPYRYDAGAINWDTGAWGNHVRPMIQEFIIDPKTRMRCEPCAVSWSDRADDNCWNCGEPRPTPSWPLPEFEPLGYLRFSDHSDRIGVIQDVEETPNGLYATLRFDDDFAAIYREMTRRLSVSFDSVARDIAIFAGSVRRVSVSIGQMRGRSALASWQDTLDEWASPTPRPIMMHGVELPADWATMRQEIPMPEIPEPPDYSSLGVQERPGSSSISRRRRERGRA